MAASSQPQVTAPIVEHRQNGFGIVHTRSRLSWRFSWQLPQETDNAPVGWMQYAYELQVKTNQQGDAQTIRVASSQSVLVPWPDNAPSLTSRSTASVRVRAFSRPQSQPQPHTDSNQDATAWSDWTAIEATLLSRKDWTASFIASATPLQEPDSPLRPVRFRKAFSTVAAGNSTKGAVTKARLYITSYGAYRAFLNGQRIGDHALTPGWTSYHHRLVFHTFDVTDLLSKSDGGGDNVLTAEVAEGWYAGRLSVRGGKRYIWGDEVALLAQLEITYANGDVDTIRTDESWQCCASATMTAEIYDGEVYDMHRERQDGQRK